MLYRSFINVVTVLVWGLLAVQVNGAFAIGLKDYFTEVWTSNEGLPHNSVNAITQTQDGYLWFATWEGVARYNGLGFELFSRSDFTGIEDAGIRTLVPEQGNCLWVAGARGGVTTRKDYSWHKQPMAKSLVNHLLIDKQRNIWLAVEGEGVFFRPYLGEGKFGEDQQVLKGSTSRLTMAQGGKIYAAAADGLYLVSEQGSSKISTDKISSTARYFYISTDHNDDVLIGTSEGAWRYDGTSYMELSPSLRHISVSVIEEDDVGSIWLGTRSHGVGRIGYDRIEFFTTDDGLPNNRVLSLFQDSEGSIWVGTNGGVLRLRNAPFTYAARNHGLLGNFVRTVLPLNGKQVMVGSSQGLSILEHNHAYPAADGDLVDQSFLSLLKRRDGSVLAGTQRTGILAWSQHALKSFLDQENGLPSNEIRAMLEDSQGRLWVGTPRGIALVSPEGNIRLINQANSELAGDYVMAFAEDERGRVWIGTAVGVSLYENGHVTTLDITPYEGAQYVFGFYIEKGFVWLTTDRGLLRYSVNTGEFGMVGKPAGLPIDKLFQIVYDRIGSFWLTSNRGIWKISYAEAHKVASGLQSSINFEHFDKADGMGSSQANGGSNPAAAIMGDGRLIFATARGISAIYPTALKQLYQYRLPVIVESIDFDGNPINPKTEHTVPSDMSRVRINYIGLGYIMPERLQYRTKLVGYEGDWSYRGHQTVAEYTNLSPGTYEFRVSARYPFGEWSDAEFVYEFDILPKFWQRSEVLGLSLIGMLLVVGGAVYWRIRSLKLRQIYLAEQVAAQTQVLREQSARYERLSNEDALTGLYNRRAFDEKISRAFSLAYDSRENLSVAVIDIDYFKQINDKYSHLTGDEVIKSFSDLLCREVSEPNIVARWGGEEFTLLLYGEAQEAYSVCQSILQKTAQLSFPELDPEFHITVSIGIAQAQGCRDYQTLLKHADQALYRAKGKGRNRVERY